jgi:hypothetical protein
MMKRLSFVLVLTVWIVQGCNWSLLDECLDYKPWEAEVFIHLSEPQAGDSTEVVIFNGRAEEADTIDWFYTRLQEESIWLPVEEYYTVKAVYRVHGKTAEVFDGKKLKITDQSDDETCWKISGEDHYVKFLYSEELE